MTLPPEDPPAAPGVTKEIEAALTEFEIAVRFAEIANTKGAQYRHDAARASLLAAIAKYGNDNWLLGYDNRRDAELEQAND